MAVPSSNSHLRNTVGGAFLHAKQGGTILNNDNTTVTNTVLGDGIITKALKLDDATADNKSEGTLPNENASGIYEVHKPLSGGTFAYQSADNFVIARSSATLSGAANTKLLFMGRGGLTPAIAQFQHDFGAKITSLMRAGRYARTGLLPDGNKLAKRSANRWFDDDGDAYLAPVTLTTTNMWSESAGAAAARADNAANPTRALPGELVLKADFVTLAVNDANAGDFYDYKPITGM